MRNDRRIWWRVLMACCAAVWLGLNALPYVTIFACTSARLVKLPPHTEAVFACEPPVAGDQQRFLEELLAARVHGPTGALRCPVQCTGDRLRIRVPFQTDAAWKAWQAYLDALERLTRANVPAEEIRRIAALDAPARERAIEQAAGGDESRARMLTEAVRHQPRLQAAREEVERLTGDPGATDAARLQAMAELLEAREAYREAFDALHVAPDALKGLLRLYDPAGAGGFAEELDRWRRRHAGRVKEIDAVFAAHRRWVDVRRRAHDPERIRRLLQMRGKLEFRIAPTLPDPEGRRDTALTAEEHRRRLAQLAADGLKGGDEQEGQFRWFPVLRGTERLSPEMVVGDYAGRKYALLYDKEGFTMLQPPGGGGKRAWSLEAAPGADDMGRPAVCFHLDPRGARRMSLLTQARRGCYMAVLVDDEVYSAPVIRATIYERGIIEGSFTRDDVRDMVRTLNTGCGPLAAPRLRLVSARSAGPTDPPDARQKRTRLWLLGAIAGVLAASCLWAAAAGWLAGSGLSAVLLGAAGAGFWHVALWRNLLVPGAWYACVTANLMAAACAAAVWLVAALTRPKAGDSAGG